MSDENPPKNNFDDENQEEIMDRLASMPYEILENRSVQY